jgi:hypothetical protein
MREDPLWRRRIYSHRSTETTSVGRTPTSNGHAQAKWGQSETLDGDVGPDGKLVMHSSLSGRFEGQVDASGGINGNYQGYCIYALTWQKR